MVIVMCLVAAFALLSWVYGPVRYKYRLTVDVSTPSGAKSGSAVQQIVVRPTLPLLAASQYTTTQEGDAVAIELPDGSTLFVLLNQEIVRSALAEGRSTDMKTPLEEAERGRVYEYSPPPPRNDGLIYLPNYVKFRDLADPASVYAVDPSDVGGGAAVSRITVQLTKERLTRTIHRRLPWLANHYGKNLRGVRSIVQVSPREDLAAAMGSGSFRMPRP